MDVALLVFWVIFVLTRVAPILLMGTRLERKERYAVRLVGSMALVTVVSLGGDAIQNLVGSAVPWVGPVASEAAFYLMVMASMLVMTLLCYRVTLQVALFCTVVSYAAENISSGTNVLVNLVLERQGIFMGRSWGLASIAVCYLLVYLVFYLLFVRRLKSEGLEVRSDKVEYALIAAVILFDIVLDNAVRQLTSSGALGEYDVLFRVGVIMCGVCILALEYELLYSRHVLAMTATLEQLMEDDRERYHLSREVIEAVNSRMHDIRHQIRRVELGEGGVQVVDRSVLESIAREVSVYDSMVKTGNDALDTVISEKALQGVGEGITLSCVADGSALRFMEDTDIYAFFGNALENALEAVRKVDDRARRNISLLVRRQAGMASVHIENYFQGTARFERGLPVTSKPDAARHGFGTKSMRMIVERYGGTLVFGTDGDLFFLDALIPMPSR